MKFKLTLLVLMMALAGCVSHYKVATYAIASPHPLHADNKSFFISLLPTREMTRHETRSERLSAALFFRYIETGPYTLSVGVRIDGSQGGVPVEVTSVGLRFASGETRAILSGHAPSLKAVTHQRAKRDQYQPRDNSSWCDFVFPLGDKLIFKADESVRVIVTVKIDGQADEVRLEAEFKGTFSEHWGSTWSLV